MPEPDAQSASQLLASLRELQERHEQLTAAAREEISALRTSLQQAHGDLALCKASKLCAADFQLPAVALPAPLRGLVPRALLKSWRDSSWQQSMDLYFRAWREQALEAQRLLGVLYVRLIGLLGV